MRFLPRSAAQRIALVAFVSYAIAMMLLGAGIYFATHAAFSRQIDMNIEQTTGALLAEYRDEGIRAVSEAVGQQRGPAPIALGTALFAPDGQIVAGDLKTALPAPGWHTITFTDPVEGPDPARAKVTRLSNGYSLVVAADLEAQEAIDRTILGMFGIALGLALVLGIGAALLLAGYLRRRLGRIEATAAAIVAGDLGQRAVVGAAGDEFDRVAISLNVMLDRISALIANLRQVSGDLAHDLRTPLSRLRHHLERLRSPESAAQASALVDHAVTQADDVLALFDAILRISEVEEGSLRRAFGPVDLSALVADLGESIAPSAEDEGHALGMCVEPGLAVMGDRELLAQAIINLVENAIRHTPTGSTIGLRAESHADTTVLIVEDNGAGIPPTERERVQQRFVRLESARSTPGHGLGLSLVHAIAKAHGALFCLDDAGPGLRAEIRFPRRISL